MPAVGLTDHANMYGAYKFIDTINKHPINLILIMKQLLKSHYWL